MVQMAEKQLHIASFTCSCSFEEF